MIRVKANRCGYTGYVCNGVAALPDVFTTPVFTGDTVRNRTDFASAARPYLDNYLNIPVHFEGFRMLVAPILVMDTGAGATVVAPEVSCMTTTDPFTVAGFVDLYDVYKSIACVTTETPPVIFVTDLPCFKPDALELPVSPGLLEPMIDTAFPPVNISTMTGIDASFDGVYIALETFHQWRIVTEARINNLIQQIYNLRGIRNVLVAMQMETSCNEFKIARTSGSILHIGSVSGGPSYSVAGGGAIVNGKIVTIGTKSFTAPFYAYINFTLTAGTGEDAGTYTITGELSNEKNANYSIGIGGVKQVDTDSYTESNTSRTRRHVLYQIVQERCNVDIDLVRMPKAGFMFYTGVGAVPFTTYAYEECESEEPSA